MTNESIGRAVKRLLDSGLVSESDLAGCSAEDIVKIEASAGVRLPDPYRQFLARMGRSAGAFLEGSDFTYPALMTLRRDAERLLVDSRAGWKLVATDFVFLGHQGYEFLFLDCARGDDPPVRLITEGEEAREVFPRFSAWLAACVEDEIAASRDAERSGTGGGR
jgi:hypothetical protein